MANVKNMAANFAAFLMVLMVFSVVLTSCQGSEDIQYFGAPAEKVPVPYAVPVNVTSYINNYSWVEDNNIMVNGYKAMTYDVFNKFAIIEMAADQQGMPSMTDERDTQWTWSDSQISTSSIETFGNDSLWISGTISPLYNEFEAVRLHAKVMKINAKYQMTGAFRLSNRDMVNFSQKLTRPYYQVDSSVRVDTITKTEKEIEIQFVEVEKHDTVTIEKEILREVFVAGAEVNTSISNNWGYSNATMTLGENMLLNLSIRHSYNPITVADFGASLTSAATATEWSFDDGQMTNSNSSTNNCSIESITMTKVDKEELEGVGCLIKTTFHVTGYYTNENGDRKDFAFDMVPMYLQVKEAAPTPQVDQFVWEFTDELKYETANGVCKGMLKVTGEKKNLRTGEVVATANLGRTNVIKIGHPTGLELYVTGTDIIGYDKDIRPFTGNDENWIGTSEKSGFQIEKNTTIYEFSTWFSADAVAGGKVGPQTQLYFLSCTVSYTDPETGEVVYSKTFEKNATSNTEEFIVEDNLVGQTQVQSDKTYKYEKSYKRTFKAYINGKEIFSPEAVSSLWLPVE